MHEATTCGPWSRSCRDSPAPHRLSPRQAAPLTCDFLPSPRSCRSGDEGGDGHWRAGVGRAAAASSATWPRRRQGYSKYIHNALCMDTQDPLGLRGYPVKEGGIANSTPVLRSTRSQIRAPDTQPVPKYQNNTPPPRRCGIPAAGGARPGGPLSGPLSAPFGAPGGPFGALSGGLGQGPPARAGRRMLALTSSSTTTTAAARVRGAPPPPPPPGDRLPSGGAPPAEQRGRASALRGGGRCAGRCPRARRRLARPASPPMRLARRAPQNLGGWCGHSGGLYVAVVLVRGQSQGPGSESGVARRLRVRGASALCQLRRAWRECLQATLA
eukprot:scaffold1629_cov369-Prasinococcus_capsulatus_cf.AAC.12